MRRNMDMSKEVENKSLPCVRGGGFAKKTRRGCKWIENNPSVSYADRADYNIKCNMKKINRLHNNSSVKCSLPQQT